MAWLLAGESKTEYDALMHGEVLEFFRLLRIYENNQKKKIEGMKKQQQKMKQKR